MLVEEVPKTNPNSSTVYFSSSINLTARPQRRALGDDEGPSSSNKRAKVNYNLTQLMQAQVQAREQSQAQIKSAQQITIERLASKRLRDLNIDPHFDLPRTFEADKRIGNTPSTKKILTARRNLNSYFEEERNLMSVNTILNSCYQFIDFSEFEKKKKQPEVVKKDKLRLCCMCGNSSSYSRCPSCGLYSCSVRCNRLHLDSRCS
ncbi:hypothetical protein DIURU_005559 [Diutina rugosa]|uniref:HIT-type domain-containing protein n=1 Tax=Diutina rugosa TaxID=5481 RepID=A0A642UFB6_DIURU|nr:uncharacterized protein DIURU_005559 [Diutina rugosa]KAA8896819.1 hypothetical protein DIURU_005559 [Diutina rugosa]